MILVAVSLTSAALSDALVSFSRASPAAPKAATADPLWPQEWSLPRVHASEAWRLLKGTRGAVVALIDSGVDVEQADLHGAFVPGRDFVDGDDDPADELGHGTLVAGVIAARANAIGGVGACPWCSIMPIRVLDAHGVATGEAIARGVFWAVDHGARVINMSFVLSGPDVEVEAALRYASDRGVVLVTAAGNGLGNTPTYPSAYPGTLSVAATDDTDRLYDWTSRGSWVDVAAPGCSVTTARGGSFTPFCGTSAATGLVAGLVGMALGIRGTGSVDIVRAITGSATPIGNVVASGRVDALRFVQALERAPATVRGRRLDGRRERPASEGPSPVSVGGALRRRCELPPAPSRGELQGSRRKRSPCADR